MGNALDRILEEKIISIIRGVESRHILDTAAALKAGGVSCMEITIDHSSEMAAESTYEMIRLLREEWGKELCIGAGTVLDAREAVRCAECGAEYIISPNVNADVIRQTKALDLVSIPGALTPSEVVQAYELGADIVKLFPAGVLGASYIKALLSPLRHIPVSAVGGVTPQNSRGFLEAGCCCVGVGSNLADHKEIAKGNFEKITGIARMYVQSVK